MSETMQAIKRKIMLVTELIQSTVGRLRIHRHTIPFCEQAVILYPLTAKPVQPDMSYRRINTFSKLSLPVPNCPIKLPPFLFFAFCRKSHLLNCTLH